MTNSNRGAKPKLSVEQEKKVADMYSIRTHTVKELAEHFNVSVFPIYKAIKKHKCVMRSQSDIQRKYPLNEEFFDIIDTQEKAYILGLLYADGCNHPESRTVTLGLQEGDRELLEHITKLIQPTKPLQYIDKKKYNEKHKDQYRLVICSKHISKSLTLLGCVKAKSHILTFPTEEQVPKYLQRHFIRVYFDGDGCVLKHPYRYFTMVGNGKFLYGLQTILIEELDFNRTKLVKNKKDRDNDIRDMRHGGIFQCISFREWIYSEASIYFKRKKQIFDTYILTDKNKPRNKNKKYELDAD